MDRDPSRPRSSPTRTAPVPVARYFHRARRLAGALAAAWIAVPCSARAEAPAAAPAPESAAPSRARVLTLREVVDLTEHNHPNVWAAAARVRQSRAQLDEAYTTPFSQFTASAGAGLAPTVRGSNVFSPNTETSISSNMGLAWRAGIEGFVPLWTFGKITSLWDAARAQVHVGESDVVKHRNLAKMDARKAYFGLQLSRDATQLLDDATPRLDSAIARLEKEVASGGADANDLLRLRAFRAELDARRAEARKYETIALAALRFLTGVPGGVDIPAEPLRPPSRRLGHVARYLDVARLHRPEVNMARAGVTARERLVDAARARYFPDVGVGVTAWWARAPEVADQLNPYVRDDANYVRYGAALVARWPLDFAPNAARVAQAEAQLEEMRQTLRYALGGVGVEVETAYAQVAEAAAKEEAYGRAAKLARQWMIAVQQGIEVGVYEDRDLVLPAKEWAVQRYNHLAATMDLNLAWSSLALATGWDALAPD